MEFCKGEFLIKTIKLIGNERKIFHCLSWMHQSVSDTINLSENIEPNEIQKFEFDIDNEKNIKNLPQDFMINFTIYTNYYEKGKLYKNDFGQATFKLIDLIKISNNNTKVRSVIRLPNVIGVSPDENDNNNISGDRGYLIIKNFQFLKLPEFKDKTKFDYDQENIQFISSIYKDYFLKRSKFINQYQGTVPEFKLILPDYRYGTDLLLPGSYYAATRLREEIGEKKLIEMFEFTMFLKFSDLNDKEDIKLYYSKFYSLSKNDQMDIISSYLTLFRLNYLGDKTDYIVKKSNCYRAAKDIEGDIILIKSRNCFNIKSVSMEHFGTDYIVIEKGDCEDLGKMAADLAYYIKNKKHESEIMNYISNLLSNFLICMSIWIVTGANVDLVGTVKNGGHSITVLIPIKYFNNLTKQTKFRTIETNIDEDLKPVILEGTANVSGIADDIKEEYNKKAKKFNNTMNIIKRCEIQFGTELPLYENESNFYSYIQEIIPYEFSNKFDQNEFLVLNKQINKIGTIGVSYKDFMTNYKNENVSSIFTVQILPNYNNDQITFFSRLLKNTVPILSYNRFNMDSSLKTNLKVFKNYLLDKKRAIENLSNVTSRINYKTVSIYLDFKDIDFNSITLHFSNLIKTEGIIGFNFKFIYISKNSGTIAFHFKKK